jgi:hypothetical protein
MPRRPPPGPRRSWPPPRHHEGDRNGEPAELDWGCALMLLILICVVLVVGIALIGANFPSDRVYSSDRMVFVCGGP